MRSVCIFKAVLDNLNLPCFLASCGYKIGKILDLVEYVLKKVAVLYGKVIYKVRVREKQFTNNVAVKLGINVRTLIVSALSFFRYTLQKKTATIGAVFFCVERIIQRPQPFQP